MFKQFFNDHRQFCRGMQVILWVLATCFCLAPFNTVRLDMARMEAKREALRPHWTAAQLFAKREELIKLTAEVSEDPQEVYRVNDMRLEWAAAVESHGTAGMWGRNDEEVRNRITLGHMMGSMEGSMRDLMQRYTRKHGKDTMQQAADAYAPKSMARPWDFPDSSWTPGYAKRFGQAWFWLGVCMFGVIFFRFAGKKNYAGFAQQLPRILLLLPLGPFALRWVEADRQAVLADCWWIAGAMNAVLAICFPAAGAMMVKAQTPPNAEKGKAASSKMGGNTKADNQTSGDDVDEALIHALKRMGLTQINVEALPATADGKLKELSVEYLGALKLGRLGQLKLFGFGELRPGSQFTNHSVTFFPLKRLPIGLTSEQGWNGKRFFGDAGVKWSISGTPGLQKPLGKIFDFATLSYTWKYAGAAPQRQLILVWDTKDWNIWKDKFSLSSEGFYRIRPGGTTNYGQPQILAQFGHCTWVKALVQFDTAGRQVGVSAGAKFFFALR